MKILGIGRNYVDHIKELDNEVPEEPLVFFKPDTAVLRGNDFYLPDYSRDLHYEVELVVRMKREGKNIQEQFAHKYYEEIGIGIDFTARDLQREAKEKGHPWTLAKGFDNSAVVSRFLKKSKFADLSDINFSLKLNDEIRQKGNSAYMINKIDYLIHYISRFITLKIGDLIFTGTPAGVGPVKIGDNLKAYIEDKLLLDINVK